MSDSRLITWYKEHSVIPTIIDNTKYSLVINGESSPNGIIFYSVFRVRDNRLVATVKIWNSSEDSKRIGEPKKTEVEEYAELSRNVIETIINTISKHLELTDVDAKKAKVLIKRTNEIPNSRQASGRIN